MPKEQTTQPIEWISEITQNLVYPVIQEQIEMAFTRAHNIIPLNGCRDYMYGYVMGMRLAGVISHEQLVALHRYIDYLYATVVQEIEKRRTLP